jgi:hypothetical protein
MMKSITTLLTLALVLGSAACSSYLSDVEDDPNNVSRLTRPGPHYIAIQALQSVQFEGQVARTAAEYVQQVAGNSRQQIGFDLYGMDPITIDPHWNAVYASARTVTGGGGLLDIRKMQQIARGLNDSLYLGISKVYEALVIGMAASIWGDIPYREAADSTNTTPVFDDQLQVYQDVLAQLDSAINVFLVATPGGTNLGPPQDNAELVYVDRGADAAALAAVYTEVAHSLKARYHMHLAEVDPANYALAAAEAALGISTVDNDMLWVHDQSPAGTNVWWQFMAARGDIGPGAAMVEIMKRRIATGFEAEERLNFYFTAADAPGAPSDFFGYRPGGSVNMQTSGGIYNGNGSPAGNYSFFNFIDPSVDPGDVRIPVITYAETRLIAAEAAFQAGGIAAAQTPFNLALASRKYGARGTTPITFPAPAGAVPATLQNIMEEKYITLFLNIEAWNDYKRTCLPSLAPAPAALGNTTPGTQGIPGRLPYGISDINANPNRPEVSPIGRNDNDPTACPVLNYTSTAPLGN